MSTRDYRKDIDGLRGLAVLLVVLFHAGFGVSGGFIGVDVFFVISGFLITGIITRDLDAGTFTLLNFWDKRVRRILPPLTLMMVVTVFVSSILMLPDDLSDLTKSAMAQVAMLANVYFWLTTGYFDGPAEQEPLLHMWSLAVEEQFYMLFPFVMILAWKICRRTLIPLLVFFTLLSFILCLYGTPRHPSASFYLLPTRAWELSIGATLSMLKHRLSMGPRISATCGLTGIIAILFAGFTFSESTRFPGWAALLPCVGAALIIAAGHSNDSWPTRLLMTKPLVSIGLISYSLYLWHWPVLVLSRYWAIEGIGFGTRVLLVLSSIGLGWLSWRFVESPFRTPKWRNTYSARSVLKGATLCNIGALVVFACFQIPGIQPWIPKQALIYASAVHDAAFLRLVEPQQAARGDFPRIGDKRRQSLDVLVWGDSHGMAVVPVIDFLCKREQIGAAMATYSSTAPLSSFIWENPHGLGERSPEFANDTIDFVKSNRIRHVFLIAVWSNYSYESKEGNTKGNFVDCLRQTVSRLRDTGAEVVIMLEVPLQGTVELPKLLARESILRRDVDAIGVTIEQHRDRVRATNEEIQSAVGGIATLLDPADFLSNGKGFFPAQKAGRSMYRDNHHLSIHGAMQLSGMFEPILQEISTLETRSTAPLDTTNMDRE